MATAFINPQTGILEVCRPPVVLAPSLPEEPPTTDFISTYADYADVFEIPRQVHEWVGAQLVASILNGKVSIDWGPTALPLDLWVLLLSGSGQGRNTITDVALKVLDEAKITGLVRNATWGSKVALYQQLAEHPQGLYVWPEFSVVMKTLNDPKFAGVKEWITDRYDSRRLPDAITYRRTGKKSDTPPIVFDAPPRMNILATSSADWFVNSLEQADAAGGFIPRWLPIQVGKPTKLIPKPVPLNEALVPELAERLAALQELKGNADLSRIEKHYAAWYYDADKRFDDQPNAALARPFFNRLRNELLKLAVIFEVSQSGTLQVTEDAFNRAVEAASKAEDSIFKLLPSGLNREGSEIEKMAALIREAGPNGIAQSKLTRAFQHIKKRERDERINTLVESERVSEAETKTGGRPLKRYFWKTR